MAEYLIQSETLDDIADAINAKTGGSSAMTPAEMVTAIGSISGGGGGGLELLASGVYTLASGGNIMTIPVSYSGMAYSVYVEGDSIADTSQTIAWMLYIDRFDAGNDYFRIISACQTKQANGTMNAQGRPNFFNFTDNTSIYVGQQSSNYPVRAGQYRWYIWGVAT